MERKHQILQQLARLWKCACLRATRGAAHLATINGAIKQGLTGPQGWQEDTTMDLWDYGPTLVICWITDMKIYTEKVPVTVIDESRLYLSLATLWTLKTVCTYLNTERFPKAHKDCHMELPQIISSGCLRYVGCCTVCILCILPWGFAIFFPHHIYINCQICY